MNWCRGDVAFIAVNFNEFGEWFDLAAIVIVEDGELRCFVDVGFLYR